MLARIRKPFLLLAAIAFVVVGIAIVITFTLRSIPIQAQMESAPTEVPAISATTLLDLARLGTWSTPGRAMPPIISQGYKVSVPREIGGYQESDFIYANGKYYLFATGSQEPAWVDVYVGETPEDLLKGPPAFTHVAPIRYPTIVKDGNTWHLWGVNPANTKTQKWTEHWTSTDADPTNFVYADTPFPNTSTPIMVDFAVRKHPTNGKWYGVGFETWSNAPLLLAEAPDASGPWTKLNYVPARKEGGVFGDTGAPPWASASRPDPNIAFTSDGLAWVFFTGKPSLTNTSEAIWRGGVVQLDVETGKAIGNSVILYDPGANKDLPFTGASDLNLVSVPGQPDQIFAYANSGDYPLAILDVPKSGIVPEGLTPTDLVNLDMGTGFDPAIGMSARILRSPYRWGADGLTVDANNGGATGYLAAARLDDLTFDVDFTPRIINKGEMNVVASIGGPPSEVITGITILIDGTQPDPNITAIITGTNKSVVRLNSDIKAIPGNRYDVELQRAGSAITLLINGTVAATATGNATLAGLESWSLAAQQAIGAPPRFPFQGTIHSFVVRGSAPDAIDPNDQ